MAETKIRDLISKINIDLSKGSNLQEYIFFGVKQLILNFLTDLNRTEEILKIFLRDLPLFVFNDENIENFNTITDFNWLKKLSFLKIVEQDILGEIYSHFLPKDWKSNNGFYLTPFIIAEWMINHSNYLNSNQFSKQIALDPCVGTGRFFLSLIKLLHQSNKLGLLDFSNLIGFENDPFSIFICRVNLSFQYILLMKIDKYSDQLKVILNIVESISKLDFLNPTMTNLNLYFSHGKTEMSKLDKIFNRISPFTNGINFVFCNPPYNKIQLTERQRKIFQKSIYGHVNAYAVFLHLSISLTSTNGTIIFIMPESFRSGLYFKNLRKFLVSNAHLDEIVLINSRTGIFNNVLQGLGIFRFRKAREDDIDKEVNIYTINDSQELSLEQIKSFSVQRIKTIYFHNKDVYFIIGENEISYQIFQKIHSKSIPLQDFISDLEITTGHIVWNRLKELLKDGKSTSLTNNDYPLIWSDNYDSFSFNFEGKSVRNRYITITDRISKFLIITPVILVKRVTAKEQNQRIIATLTPSNITNFFVENHSNIIFSPSADSTDQLCIVGYLNSSIANYLFTLLNGNTQVSATELRLLPFPKMAYEQKNSISSLVKKILHQELEPTEKKSLISEINLFFYDVFDLNKTFQEEITRKLKKEK